MKVNFKIIQSNTIEFNGVHIDLHNNFDFKGIYEDVQMNEIALEWYRTDGDWVKPNEFSKLTFKLKNINYKFFKQKSDNNDYPEDSERLGEISFFPSTERDINDSFINQEMPRDGDDLIFLFEDESVIRFNCEEAELIVQQ